MVEDDASRQTVDRIPSAFFWLLGSSAGKHHPQLWSTGGLLRDEIREPDRNLFWVNPDFSAGARDWIRKPVDIFALGICAA